jgi:hypothetical protein
MDSFCKTQGLKMEVKVITDTKDFQRLLNNGEGDVIASNLVVSLEDEKRLAYSTPYYYTHQVLVQRSNDTLIKEPAELANQTVCVRKNSPFSRRLTDLQDEIGARINIRYKTENPITEDLIEMVANNDIPFTIAHENLARISKEMHPNLNIDTRISFQQKIAFGLRLNSPELKKKMGDLATKNNVLVNNLYLAYDRMLASYNFFTSLLKENPKAEQFDGLGEEDITYLTPEDLVSLKDKDGNFLVQRKDEEGDVKKQQTSFKMDGLIKNISGQADDKPVILKGQDKIFAKEIQIKQGMIQFKLVLGKPPRGTKTDINKV